MGAVDVPRAGRVRGVIFDLDGTLVDGYDGIAIAVNAARAHFGMSPLTTDDIKGRVGLGLEHLMSDVVGGARAPEGATIFRNVYDTVCVDHTRAAPGLGETLATLRKRGFRMSLASNKPALYSIRILERLAVLPYFDLVAGPETAGAIKPHPAMVRACLEAMKVDASQAIYVGDMTLDAETARRAGVRVVLVAGGSSPLDDLTRTGHPVIATLPDLIEHLPSQAAIRENVP
jgi:phosphoglycolate phosphatase